MFAMLRAALTGVFLAGLLAPLAAQTEIPISETALSEMPQVYEPAKADPAINPFRSPRFEGIKVESPFTIPSDPSLRPDVTALAGATPRVLPPIGSRPLISFPGIKYSLSTPPDPELAVGPRDVIQAVNLRIAFFNKFTGVQTFEQPLDTFFKVPGGGKYLSDPKLAFDPGAGRFYATLLEVRNATQESYLHLAVSKTSNPKDGWFLYRINVLFSQSGLKYWTDFPMLGFSKDGLVISGNAFPFTDGASFGSRILCIRKTQILTGAKAVLTFFNEPNSYGIQPAKHNEAALDRIYGVNVRFTTALQIYCFQNLGGVPKLTKLLEPPAPKPKVVVVPEMLAPKSAPSKNGRFLDAIDGRLTSCWFRAGRLYVAHGARISAADQRSQVRWYEINANAWPNNPEVTPTLIQRGAVSGGSGQAVFVPAISANRDGDISLLFTRSSPSIVADLMTASRKATDANGAMGAAVLRLSSNGTRFSNNTSSGSPARWGDYFGLVPDPIDGTTFWATAQVGNFVGSQPNEWLTTVFSFTVRPETKASQILFGITKAVGGSAFGNGLTVKLSDDVYHKVNAAGTPLKAGANYTFRVTGDRTRVSGLDFVVEYGGVAGGTVDFTILNRRTGLQEPIGTAPLLATDRKATLKFRGLYSDYFDAKGDVVFRGVATAPTFFTYRTDFATLVVYRV